MLTPSGQGLYFLSFLSLNLIIPHHLAWCTLYSSVHIPWIYTLISQDQHQFPRHTTQCKWDLCMGSCVCEQELSCLPWPCENTAFIAGAWTQTQTLLRKQAKSWSFHLAWIWKFCSSAVLNSSCEKTPTTKIRQRLVWEVFWQIFQRASSTFLVPKAVWPPLLPQGRAGWAQFFCC